MLTRAPTEATRRATDASQLLRVARASANTGASVNGSIHEARPFRLDNRRSSRRFDIQPRFVLFESFCAALKGTIAKQPADTDALGELRRARPVADSLRPRVRTSQTGFRRCTKPREADRLGESTRMNRQVESHSVSRPGDSREECRSRVTSDVASTDFRRRSHRETTAQATKLASRSEELSPPDKVTDDAKQRAFCLRELATQMQSPKSTGEFAGY